jgi:hypothetical protein
MNLRYKRATTAFGMEHSKAKLQIVLGPAIQPAESFVEILE